MLFLGILSDFFSDLGDKIVGMFMVGIRTIFYALDSIIYGLIVKLYDVFEFLCSTRLLNGSLLDAIATRVGAILGLVMLVSVIVSFVNMLVNPDSVSDNEKGAVSIIKKVLVVIVMLGVSSYVFDALFTIQYNVISSGAISKILLPKIVVKAQLDGKGHVAKDSDGNIEALRDKDGNYVLIDNFGGILSEETFYAFFRIDLDVSQLEEGSSAISDINYCKSVLNKLRSTIADGEPNFNLGTLCLNRPINETIKVKAADGTEETKEIDDFMVNYTFGLSTIVGIALCYLLLVYCINVGSRMLQIMVLEIISPMAFVSYLSPKKDNMFSKWKNIYISTYIDVFIRVAIINFAVMLISALFANGNGMGGFEFFDAIDSSKFSVGWRYFIIVLMCLAILSFAKRAPELLKELLPSGSASKIGFGGAKMSDFLGLGAAVGLGTAVGVGVGGRTLAAVGRVPRGIGNSFNRIRSANGAGGKAKAIGKEILRLPFGVGGWAAGSAGSIVAGGVGGAFRGAIAGNSSKNLVGAVKAGQQTQSKANQKVNQRHFKGGHIYDGVGDAVNQTFGLISGYEYLDAEVTSYNNLKADIDGDDRVKGDQMAMDRAWSHLVESGYAHDFDYWQEHEGAVYKARLDATKTVAYQDMFENNDAFKTKVLMHNKRFGTNYNKKTEWKPINDRRKQLSAKLEKRSARKPSN